MGGSVTRVIRQKEAAVDPMSDPGPPTRVYGETTHLHGDDIIANDLCHIKKKCHICISADKVL